MIVGVDNGNSGAVCVLRPDGSIAGYRANPVWISHTHKEIDVVELFDFARSFGGPIKLGVEEPLHHAPSAQALRSMALNVGLMAGAARLCPDIELHRIEVRDWQKALLAPKRKPKDTKERALTAAKKIWPDEKWLATPRSTVPHDGIVDAALIAFYLLHTTKHHEPDRHSGATGSSC